MEYKDQKRIFKDVVEGKQKGLGMNDKFQFSCIGCGKCCFNNDVMVNTYDLVRMRRSLKLSTQEILKRDLLNLYLGPSSGLPILSINFKKFGENSTKCPFLAPVINAQDLAKKIEEQTGSKEVFNEKLEEYKKDPTKLAKDLQGIKIEKWLCTIHKDRPMICRLYPCGRIQKIDQKDPSKIEEMYLLQKDQKGFCPGFEEKKEQTLGQFLVEQGVPEYREGSNVYKDTIDALMKVGLFKSTKENKGSKVQDNSPILNFVANLMYNFDSFNAFSKDDRVLKTITDDNATHEDFMYVTKKVLDSVRWFCKVFEEKSPYDLLQFIQSMKGGGINA